MKIICGPRKTYVQGFGISAKSILAISQELILRDSNPYSYILTYKLSQDTLEMFFSKVRGRLSWNNNPNALQIKYALRALLLKNKVAIECPATANCTEVEGENNLKDVPVSSSDEPDSCTQSMDEL